MKISALIISIITSATGFAQVKDTIVRNLQRPQQYNVIYSQLYVINSDIGDVTFYDQGHPDGRQYILNGNIIPNYYVFPRKWPVSLVLTPIVRVRIIANQRSLPVRTPSFAPGGHIYFPLNRTSIANYKYIGIGIFHHSNGQDGPPLDANGNPNLINGNFATNYITADLNLGNINENRNKYLRVGIEAHSGLLKFGDEPAYRNRFSKLRLNYELAYAKFVKSIMSFEGKDVDESDEERYRVVLNGMFVLDNIQATWNQHFNIELKLYRKILHSENTAFFFSTGYMGHDYYNIYFYEPYPFVRVGFAASNAFFYNNRFKAAKRNLQKFTSPQ